MRYLIPIVIFHIFLIENSFCQDSIEPAKNYTEREIFFSYNGDSICGRLILPEKATKKLPIVVFVHGSGPVNYDGYGYFPYLWRVFSDKGFASFSWDKPGIGKSKGDWTKLAIDDRARLAAKAIEVIKTIPDIDTNSIGLWGISQAGWVIPRIVTKITPSFTICVSCPVTTCFDQELYRVKNELSADNYNKDQIDSALVFAELRLKMAANGSSFSGFNKYQENLVGIKWFDDYIFKMDSSQYGLLKLLIKYDQVPEVGVIREPLLAIWGENDMLVPAMISSEFYKEEMKKNGNSTAIIKVLKNGDHALFYNESGGKKAMMEMYRSGNIQWAPGYMEEMVNFLEKFIR